MVYPYHTHTHCTHRASLKLLHYERCIYFYDYMYTADFKTIFIFIAIAIITFIVISMLVCCEMLCFIFAA